MIYIEVKRSHIARALELQRRGGLYDCSDPVSLALRDCLGKSVRIIESEGGPDRAIVGRNTVILLPQEVRDFLALWDFGMSPNPVSFVIALP